MRYIAVCSATVLGVIAFQGNSAHALSMHQCSAKYQAAKTAGTLNGMKWNEFRKTECGAEATAAPAPTAAPLSPRQPTGFRCVSAALSTRRPKLPARSMA